MFEALNFCKDLLGKFGGPKAARVSLPALNLEALRSRLKRSHQCLNQNT